MAKGAFTAALLALFTNSAGAADINNSPGFSYTGKFFYS